MNQLLFVRHAETDMAGRFCGHSDPQLNERGYAQLPAVIAELRACNIAAIYTSDLRRAQTTADALAEAFHLHCHASPVWREIDFGQWEGLSWEEVEDRDKAYAERWVTMFPDLPAPQGETVHAFERRILDAVASLTARPSDGDIAIVTHAGVLRTILRRLQDCSKQEAWDRTKPYGCIIRHAASQLSRQDFSLRNEVLL